MRGILQSVWIEDVAQQLSSFTLAFFKINSEVLQDKAYKNRLKYFDKHRMLKV